MTNTSMGERASYVCDMAGCFMTVRVRGEIDHHTAVAIRNGIDAALFEKRPRRLILDLSAVSFMDSSGLGLIMGRFSVMKELGGDLVVWNPSRETRSILTLAGMERFVRIEAPEKSPEDPPGGIPNGAKSPEPTGQATPRSATQRRTGTAASGSRSGRARTARSTGRARKTKPSA